MILALKYKQSVVIAKKVLAPKILGFIKNPPITSAARSLNAVTSQQHIVCFIAQEVEHCIIITEDIGLILIVGYDFFV